MKTVFNGKTHKLDSLLRYRHKPRMKTDTVWNSQLSHRTLPQRPIRKSETTATNPLHRHGYDRRQGSIVSSLLFRTRPTHSVGWCRMETTDGVFVHILLLRGRGEGGRERQRERQRERGGADWDSETERGVRKNKDRQREMERGTEKTETEGERDTETKRWW